MDKSPPNFFIQHSVLAHIKSQTGSVRIRDVIDALQTQNFFEKDIQEAIRTLLERGPLDLDADMRLIITE